MRCFLKNVLIYSAIILALIAACEPVVRRLPSAYKYKAGWMDAHAHDVRTLILGLSHTYYGLMPDSLGPGTFNLANVTQPPDYDLALLRQYIDSMPGLQRVIVPISYCTYRDELFEDTGLWPWAVRYKVDMHLPLHSDWSIYNLSIADFDTWRGKLAGLFFEQKSNTCDSLGFGLGFDLAGRERWWASSGYETARKHTLPYIGRDTVVLACQREIIDLCRSRGAEPVFVTTPCWISYRENLDSVQLAEMRGHISYLVKDLGVRYYDFMADPRFVDEDFHDSDHLSDIGAAKLSRILRDTLNNPFSPGVTNVFTKKENYELQNRRNRRDRSDLCRQAPGGGYIHYRGAAGSVCREERPR